MLLAGKTQAGLLSLWGERDCHATYYVLHDAIRDHVFASLEVGILQLVQKVAQISWTRLLGPAAGQCRELALTVPFMGQWHYEIMPWLPQATRCSSNNALSPDACSIPMCAPESQAIRKSRLTATHQATIVYDITSRAHCPLPTRSCTPPPLRLWISWLCLVTSSRTQSRAPMNLSFSSCRVKRCPCTAEFGFCAMRFRATIWVVMRSHTCSWDSTSSVREWQRDGSMAEQCLWRSCRYSGPSSTAVPAFA